MSSNLPTPPEPTSTLVITKRACGKKFVFTPLNDTRVLYYIVVPSRYNLKRHACSWPAIIHAGDNPKYHSLSQSPIVGRCKRTIWWREISIEFGGSIQRDVKKDEKRKKEGKLKRANGLRKFFGMKPKELEWSEEDEAATTEDERRGESRTLKMKHTGHRKYEFSVDGVNYRWTGTRMHAGTFINWLGLKGFAYHVKLVRMDDHKLVASFKKTYWAGKERKFGELNIYADEQQAILDEFLIIQTAFCVTKAEKDKRDTGWDNMRLAGY